MAEQKRRTAQKVLTAATTIAHWEDHLLEPSIMPLFFGSGHFAEHFGWDRDMVQIHIRRGYLPAVFHYGCRWIHKDDGIVYATFRMTHIFNTRMKEWPVYEEVSILTRRKQLLEWLKENPDKVPKNFTNLQAAAAAKRKEKARNLLIPYNKDADSEPEDDTAWYLK